QDVGKAEQREAADHQPRLAEQIGGGADDRLDDRKRKGEHRGKARGGRDADAEILGDVRQHRIERTRRECCCQTCARDDVERSRQAVIVRPRLSVLHQRGFFASASNAMSVRISPSNSRSGTMLGPSEGALSGSGWVSTKTPATPTATAARASTGTNSRSPPE